MSEFSVIVEFNDETGVDSRLDGNDIMLGQHDYSPSFMLQPQPLLYTSSPDETAFTQQQQQQQQEQANMPAALPPLTEDATPDPVKTVDEMVVGKWGDLNETLMELSPSDNWQFNENSDRYEFVRGERINWVLKKKLIPSDKLKFILLHHKDKEQHRQVIKTCNDPEHNNNDFMFAPFSLEVDGCPGACIERRIDENNHFEYTITNISGGRGKILTFVFYCNSSETVNRGQKEENRKWKLLAKGTVNSDEVSQEFPLQVFKMLRNPNRLKRPMKRGRSGFIVKRERLDSTLLDTIQNGQRQELRSLLIQQLDEKLAAFSDNEVESLLNLRNKIQLQI